MMFSRTLQLDDDFKLPVASETSLAQVVCLDGPTHHVYRTPMLGDLLVGQDFVLPEDPAIKLRCGRFLIRSIF